VPLEEPRVVLRRELEASGRSLSIARYIATQRAVSDTCSIACGIVYLRA